MPKFGIDEDNDLATSKKGRTQRGRTQGSPVRVIRASAPLLSHFIKSIKFPSQRIVLNVLPDHCQV